MLGTSNLGCPAEPPHLSATAYQARAPIRVALIQSSGGPEAHMRGKYSQKTRIHSLVAYLVCY